MNAALRAVWVVFVLSLIVTVGRRGVVAVAGIQVVVAGVILAAHVIVSRRIGCAPVSFLADVFRPVLGSVVAGSLVMILQVALPDSWSAPTSWAALIGTGLVFVALYVASLRLIAPAVLDDLRNFRRRLASSTRESIGEPTHP